ncbi:plasmid partitioning protein [Escherichia phage vB_EcoM-673R5]|nr:plasmid partitioning protein [Escherichia phage vB_EcoM-673R5]
MSKKNRPTIGRTLNPSILSGFDSSSASGDRVEQVFKLSTGRQATFIEEVIPPNQVKAIPLLISITTGVTRHLLRQNH